MNEDPTHLDKVKFACKGCGRNVIFADVKKNPTRTKYCDHCHKIAMDNRDPLVTLFCVVCNDPFHPNMNYKRIGKLPKYCSPEHRDRDAKSFLSPIFIATNGMPKRLSDASIEKIRVVYIEAKENKSKPLGKVADELSNEYGISASTVRQIVYKQGTYKTT